MVVGFVGEGLVLPTCADVLVLGENKGGLVERCRGAVVNFSITILAVVGGSIVGQDLDVLIAVVHLALLEINGGVHLVTKTVEPGAQAAVVATVKIIGADSTEGIVVIVITVINLLLGSVGAAVSHIEILIAAARLDATALEIHQIGDALVHIAAAEAGAGSDFPVTLSQVEAAQVGDIKAVLAFGARLVFVSVGVRCGSPLRDGDIYVGVSGPKSDFTALGGVVLPGIGTQVHGAILHCLGGTGSATFDTERAACVVLDRPRCVGPCRLPRQQCRYCQHKREDLVKFLTHYSFHYCFLFFHTK